MAIQHVEVHGGTQHQTKTPPQPQATPEQTQRLIGGSDPLNSTSTSSSISNQSPLSDDSITANTASSATVTKAKPQSSTTTKPRPRSKSTPKPAGTSTNPSISEKPPAPARTRNTANQRTARLRRKTYVADLEAKLAHYETQTSLQQTRNQEVFQDLAEENRRLRWMLDTQQGQQGRCGNCGASGSLLDAPLQSTQHGSVGNGAGRMVQLPSPPSTTASASLEGDRYRNMQSQSQSQQQQQQQQQQGPPHWLGQWHEPLSRQPQQPRHVEENTAGHKRHMSYNDAQSFAANQQYLPGGKFEVKQRMQDRPIMDMVREVGREEEVAAIIASLRGADVRMADCRA